MRKTLIIFLITTLFSLSARGEKITPAPLRDLLASTDAEPQAPATALSTEAGLPGQEPVAAASLPSSDFFTLDPANDPSPDQYELKLPDDLPDSDIPLTVNDQVAYFVTHFQTKGREVFARWLSRSERYIPMMKDVLRSKGLPEDLVYLAMIESGFQPHAYSSARAVGPWQFMPQTARGFSLRIDPWIDERRDPLKSTTAAALYLKELYTLFDKDWYLAAAGYNAGENKILRAINKYNSRDFWQLTEGSYLKRETKDYVPKLLAAAIIAKDPAKYGFADVAYLPPIEFDTVTISNRTDLDVVAKLCNVSVDTIRQLNPELRMWCTPPNFPNYELKIPKGKRELFLDGYAKIPESQLYTERVVYTRYKAKKRDTLASVARRFGTTTTNIADLNNLGRRKKLAGMSLLVPVKPSSAKKAKSSGGAHSGGKAFTKYYTVRKGDTLSAVARKFNISPAKLASWNNLGKKASLSPGKRLVVARFVEKKGALVVKGAS